MAEFSESRFPVGSSARMSVGWVTTARRLLRPRGSLFLIWRADGLADVLDSLAPAFGGVAVLPVYPKPGQDAIRIIVEQAKVPVVVDAGIGVPSDASISMELGASACLVNTAIARAHDPALMARAMRLGVEAGRAAFLAGRMPVLPYAAASSPAEGVVR